MNDEPTEAARNLELDAAFRSFVAAKIEAGYSKEEAFKIMRAEIARLARKSFRVVD